MWSKFKPNQEEVENVDYQVEVPEEEEADDYNYQPSNDDIKATSLNWIKKTIQIKHLLTMKLHSCHTPVLL